MRSRRHCRNASGASGATVSLLLAMVTAVASCSSLGPRTELHKMHTRGPRVGGATVTGRALSRGHATRSELAQLPGLARVHHASLQAHEASPRHPPQPRVGGLTAQTCE